MQQIFHSSQIIREIQIQFTKWYFKLEFYGETKFLSFYKN